MIRILYILLFFTWTLFAIAQRSDNHPERTPEDFAQKHTEMLVRELNIADTAMRDTIYRMHLKYALQRTTSFTREDHIRVMRMILGELQQILSHEQYVVFINRKHHYAPRSHQRYCNWIAPHQYDDSLSLPIDTAGYTQLPPSDHLP